jgi:NAD/NADP transhydrogenase beta subunit
MQADGQSSLLTYVITAVVIAVVFAVRWRRMSRVRPLKLERLWILPGLFAVLVGITFAMTPPVGWGWAFCLAALMLGGALGWTRGKLMRITVDPETHALSQSSSPAAMLFILAIVAVRQGARAGGAGWLHLDALAMTDMLMSLALGLFAAQRLEMFLRARRMLATARGPVIPG